MEKFLNNTKSRFIYMTMAAFMFLFILASYLYLFKKPLVEYSELQQSKTLLLAKMGNATMFSPEIEKLKNEVALLTKHLHGDDPARSEDEILADRIDKLDRISSDHQISLLSVKPGIPRAISKFKEISFDVEVKGRYLQLYEWFHTVERQFGSMVVKQFEMQPINGSRKLLIKMRMVSYIATR